MNLLWFSLVLILVILVCVKDFYHWKREKELLNRLLEKNGLVPIDEEIRQKPLPTPVEKRKLSFKFRQP